MANQEGRVEGRKSTNSAVVELRQAFIDYEQRITIKFGKMMFFNFMATIGTLAILLPLIIK